jgi:hypothetical protein
MRRGKNFQGKESLGCLSLIIHEASVWLVSIDSYVTGYFILSRFVTYVSFLEPIYFKAMYYT